MIRLLARNRGLWTACLAIVLASFALSFALYDRLPDPVPTHWNLSGNADGFTAKPWGAYAMPAIIAGVLALFAFLPALSPKGFRIPVESTGYRASLLIVTLLLSALHVITIASALDAVTMEAALPILLGAFFVLLGNILPTVRRNFYIGIRTPWTLADEEVWSRTHRWGGRAFVAGGAVMIVLGAAGAPVPLAFATLFVFALAPAVYSYVAYRSLHRVA